MTDRKERFREASKRAVEGMGGTMTPEEMLIN